MRMEKIIATDFAMEISLLLNKGLGRKYQLQCCCYVVIELQQRIL